MNMINDISKINRKGDRTARLVVEKVEDFDYENN